MQDGKVRLAGATDLHRPRLRWKLRRIIADAQ